MTPPEPVPHPVDSSELARALRTTHRCVLALLVACAIFLALTAGTLGADEPSELVGSGLPPRPFTLAAVGLALAVIATRRLSSSPAIAARARVGLWLASLACAALLGLLAAALGGLHGATQPALAFTLAAAMLVLRQPLLSQATAPHAKG